MGSHSPVVTRSGFADTFILSGLMDPNSILKEISWSHKVNFVTICTTATGLIKSKFDKTLLAEIYVRYGRRAPLHSVRSRGQVRIMSCAPASHNHKYSSHLEEMYHDSLHSSGRQTQRRTDPAKANGCVVYAEHSRRRTWALSPYLWWNPSSFDYGRRLWKSWCVGALYALRGNLWS